MADGAGSNNVLGKFSLPATAGLVVVMNLILTTIRFNKHVWLVRRSMCTTTT